MVRSTRLRTLGRRRAVVVLVALALATSACGLQQAGLDGTVAGQAALTSSTGTNGDNGLGGTDPVTGAPLGSDGSVATDGTVASGGTQGSVGGSNGSVSGGGVGGTGGTSSSNGTPPGLQQTPGLKGEVVVAYVNVTGFDQLGKVVVINTASTGDARAQTNALAAYVNAHGGIAGRKLVPKVHDYNAQQASEVNDNNLCQAIADTDKAFMAVLHGQIHFSARDCYKAKQVLAFEGAAYGFGRDFYTDHAPYLWSPSYADYDQTSRALVDTIKAKKWLTGETKVGIVLWDDKPYHDIADKALAPRLKALGVDVVQASISNSDIGSIENGIHAAAQTMIVNQVDHLLFVGSAPLQPFFVQQNQQYEQFRYALNSFDVPRYMAVNFPRNMVGSLGIGFSPVDDMLDAQHKFPQPGLESQCQAIYKASGVSVPGRYLNGVYNSKQSMSYCESTLLLKNVADTIPNSLTVPAWSRAAEGLGNSFQVAQTFLTSYSPNKHSGAAAYREITYDGGPCKCMTYTSGNKALS